MIIEMEFPNDQLFGKELKFKVAMQSTESYFSLSCKYAEPLSIRDKRVQSFYKQIYNSYALLKEAPQYFGILGEKKDETRLGQNKSSGAGNPLSNTDKNDAGHIQMV